MTLRANLEAAFVRIGSEFKSLRVLISGSGTGDVSGLSTTASNLVGAINEVRATAGAAVTSVNGVVGPGPIIVGSDAVAEGAVNLYHTPARVIAAPLTGFAAAAGTVAAADSVLQAIQKLQGNAASLINDVTPGATTVYSSNRTESQIATAIANVVGAAPAALDTLFEIATALNSDAAAFTTLSNAIALKANILDTYSRTELGAGVDTADYEATFVAALL